MFMYSFNSGILAVQYGTADRTTNDCLTLQQSVLVTGAGVLSQE